MIAKAAACDGTHGFSSVQLAHRAADRKKGRGVYKCQFCRLWHVGNLPKRDNARPKQS